ncbi:hypothetical protein MNBD_ALPHA09-54 [hydrothermal vent metagenome]|uniref:Thioredoxin domain-containing protein n=1 Tax=hydrothermal vent metagenome TaxID=652676 RepID=A0A3B0T6C2_9ZZZZ
MVRLILSCLAASVLLFGPVAAQDIVLAGKATMAPMTPAASEDQSGAHGHDSQPIDLDLALEKSEAALGRTIGDYTLTDDSGNTLTLAEFRGKPLVISPIYASCPMICPMITQHLIKAVARAEEIFGPGRFNILTVSFNPARDRPARLAAFRSEQDVPLDNWFIAVGDEATTKKFMDDLGFSYRATAGGYDHVTQTTILDSEGRVYRQVYGVDFPIQVFLEPMKEVVFGTGLKSLSMTSLVDRILFICTVYNPTSGRYEIDYAIAFGISIGGLSLLLTGFIIFRVWRQNRRLQRRSVRG